MAEKQMTERQFWTREDEQQFADFLNEYPMLWDHRLNEYSNRPLKESSYLEIATEIGKNGYALYNFDTSERVDLMGKSAQKAKLIEHKYRKLLKEREVFINIHTEFGQPGEYICRVANEEKAQMIVVGTRGMGVLRRTILGSVSDYVAHHAHCPVLVARQ